MAIENRSNHRAMDIRSAAGLYQATIIAEQRCGAGLGGVENQLANEARRDNIARLASGLPVCVARVSVEDAGSFGCT